MTSARAYVDADVAVMTSAGNPMACEARGSTRQNFGWRMRVRGSFDVEVSGYVE